MKCTTPEKETKQEILGTDYEKNRKFITTDKSQLVEEEILEEANDGIKLQSRAMRVEVLGDLFLKDYHKKLLPLVYIKQAQDRLNKESKPEKKAEDNSAVVNLTQGGESNESDEVQNIDDMTMEEAIQKLVCDVPQNEI